MTSMVIVKAAEIASAPLAPSGRRVGADSGDPQLGLKTFASEATGNLGIWNASLAGGLW